MAKSQKLPDDMFGEKRHFRMTFSKVLPEYCLMILIKTKLDSYREVSLHKFWRCFGDVSGTLRGRFGDVCGFWDSF